MTQALRRLSPLAIALRPRPVFGYARKSKEDAEAQINSIERQMEDITAFSVRQGYGPVDQWYTDEESAKSFDRPGYELLIAACEANPQPRSAPGRIICRDYDRFSRPVDERLKVNPIEYQRQIIRLYDAGWELDYEQTPKTGNQLLDGLTGSLKAMMAGEYIEKLSNNVRSGKRKAGMKGFWTGGPAPFPASRYNADDPTHQFPLPRGMRAKNGQAVLGPDLAHPEYRTYWEEAARHILAGGTLDGVADLFDQWRIPRFYDGVTVKKGRRKGTVLGLSWRHANIYKVFTNPALVGHVEYTFTKDDGSSEHHIGDAQWAPLVDPKLFFAVRDELVQRREKATRAPRNQDYFLELECYQCAAKFVSATFTSKAKGKEGERRRNYTHPVPAARMNAVQAQRTKKHGCRHWYIEAVAVENAVRDIILEKRASKEFYESFANLMDEQDAVQKEAERMEIAALTTVKSLESQRDNLKKALRFAESDDEREAIMRDVRALVAQITEAEVAVNQSRIRVSQARNMSTDLLSTVEEAQAIAGAWDLPGEEGKLARRRLVDLWVAKLWIEITPVPDRPRSAIKKLHIVLRTAPDTAITRDLTQQLEGDISSEPSPSNCYGFAPEVHILTLNAA